MLMHGENDNDVPIAESEQFHIGLKDAGVETVMVLSPPFLASFDAAPALHYFASQVLSNASVSSQQSPCGRSKPTQHSRGLAMAPTIAPSRPLLCLRLPLWAMSAIMLLAGCATNKPATEDDFGVLVMAHGGSPEWNEDVLAAVEPLQAIHNIDVAFGMADAATLQSSVERLEARGARRIGVVRLFISGDSFRKQTEQILGIAPGAPQKPPVAADHANHAGHGAAHSMEFWKITTNASFRLSDQGLVEASEMGEVLVDRARALSREPRHEDVLILAHGPGDDAENQRWLAHLEARAATVRKTLPFRTVRVETLREDWPEKRAEAEVRIREFVAAAAKENGRAIVIPFRVQGFGPYAKVLEGLDYASDGQGLIPDPNVTKWIANQIETLQRGEFRAASDASTAGH